MPVKTAARVSSLLLASFVLAASLHAAPAADRPVKEPPLLDKIVRKLRWFVRTNESMISVPKP